jgi:hypothetical protein
MLYDTTDEHCSSFEVYYTVKKLFNIAVLYIGFIYETWY